MSYNCVAATSYGMIIFLYGPDTYRSRKKLKEIIARYKEIYSSGLSLHVLDVDKNNFDEFRNAVEAVAMFEEEKKLVVAGNFITAKEHLERFMEWGGKENLKNTEDTICVIYEHDIHKNTSAFRWLSKNAKSQEFNILSGLQLNKWAQGFVRGSGIKIAPGALSRLLAFTGGDLWSFENELKKLWSYVRRGPTAARGSDPVEISEKDLDVFLRPVEQAHIFSLVDAVIERNRAKAFRLLKAHIEAGDNGNYLFFMIYNQFRNIAQVQSHLEGVGGNGSAMVSIAGMHPYVVKKSMAQARRFDRDSIKKIYNDFVDLDIAIKTGGVEPIAALERLILVV